MSDELRADVTTYSAEPITQERMVEFLDGFVRRAGEGPKDEWVLSVDQLKALVGEGR